MTISYYLIIQTVETHFILSKLKKRRFIQVGYLNILECKNV